VFAGHCSVRQIKEYLEEMLGQAEIPHGDLVKQAQALDLRLGAITTHGQ
jgi:hypothetical protein